MKLKQPWIGILLILVLLSVGVWLLLAPTTLTPETQLARGARADLLGMTGSVREFYLAEAGESPEAENEMLLAMGDYFAHRVSYPTGFFDPNWLLDAAKTDQFVLSALPAGQVAYDTSEDDLSPLNLSPNAFTSLGPQPLDMTGCQGCFDFGVVGGRTNFIVSDPISTNIAYLGSDGGGVWKTTNCCDENTTWIDTTDDPLLSSIAIGHITLDPENHNTIYAATGDLRYGSWSFGSAGLLKSTDAGASWQILGADVFTPVYSQTAGGFPQYQAIGKVAVDPRDSDNLIVTTKTGVYFSYDAGENWDGPCYTNNFLDQRQDGTGLVVRDDGTSTTVYVAIGTRGFATPVQPDLSNTGANGVYRTTLPASGCPASWDLLNTGWPTGTGDGNPNNDLVGRIDLAVAPSNPNYIYAQVANNTNASGTLGVWRTIDGGMTWTQQATPSDFTGCAGGTGQTWYNAGVTVDPNDPNVVFLSMIDLFRSFNGADTFVNLTCGYAGSNDVHVDHHARTYVGNDSSQLLVGSDGGVYITHNANTANPDDVAFTQMNNTLSTIEFYAGDITANFATSANPGINGGAQDNGSMVNVWTGEDPGPSEWRMTTGGDGMYARIEPAQGQRWYQESQNAGLKVSQTGPYGFYSSAVGPWGGDRISFVFPYEIYKHCPDPGPCEHMIAGTQRVWETIQGAIPGSSWYPNSPDLTKNTLGNRSFINQLSFSVTDPTVVIVGTNDGNVQYGFNMGSGTPNSATWVDVTDGNTILPNRPILDVTTHPVTPTIGLAAVGGFEENTPATPGHVYQVTCNADCSAFTWEDKSGNLPNIPANTIMANPNIPQQVFVGTDWGLYFTNDISQSPPTWFRFDAGVPSVMIWEMSIDRGFTTLALFTRSRGAFAWPLPVAQSVTMSSQSTQHVLPGSTVVHDFTLTNVGTVDDSYDLNLTPDTWNATLLTASPVAVTAGEAVTVQVQVDVPLTAHFNEMDVFTVTATSVTTSSLSVQGLGVTVATGDTDVASSADQSQVGVPGEALTYTIMVTNTGDLADSFHVEFGPANWTYTSSTAVVGPLAPGASEMVEVYVTIGVGAVDSVDVIFRSEFNAAVTAVTTLDTMSIFAGVSVNGNTNRFGDPGSTVTYTLRPRNDGSVPDTYDVIVGSSVWATVSESGTVGELQPGQRGEVEVYVTVGSGMSDTVDIGFVSQFYPSVFLTVTLVTTSTSPGVAGVATSADLSQVGVAGETVTYMVMVTNTGSVEDSFVIDLGPSNWTTTSSVTTTMPLAAGAATAVEVSVTIGAGASDSVAVTFTSTFDEAVSAGVTLNTSTNLTFLPFVVRDS